MDNVEQRDGQPGEGRRIADSHCVMHWVRGPIGKLDAIESQGHAQQNEQCQGRLFAMPDHYLTPKTGTPPLLFPKGGIEQKMGQNANQNRDDEDRDVAQWHLQCCKPISTHEHPGEFSHIRHRRRFCHRGEIQVSFIALP
jgi:hypothetical protein